MMSRRVAAGTNISSVVRAHTADPSTNASSRREALVLQLHGWEVEHHHGRIGEPNAKPYGNGVLLWFEIDDIDAAIARATELEAEIVMPRHRNPPEGDGGPNHWEVWLRDLDGYTVVLASPDGSAR